MKWMIKVLIVLISMVLPVLALADSHMTTPPKMYLSPDGKIYIKSKTPLYIRLSTSADETAPGYIMRNQDSLDPNKKPSPFFTEGHGQHSVVHPPDHKNIQDRKGSHLFYLHEDGRVPRTTISVSKVPWVLNGKVYIYGKPIKVSIKFTDKDSGVFAGYTALNSDTFAEYGQALSLTEEKDYTLKYFAFDNVGNKTREFVRLISLDFTAPESSFKVLGKQIKIGDEIVVGPTARITLSSRDLKAGVKQIRYRFKGARGIYKNKPLTMKGLKDGPHELVFAAEDRVTNLEGNQTFTFYLDSVPPVVVHKLLGDQYVKEKSTYVSGRTQVELTATDNKAGVHEIRYYLPLKKRRIYSEPFMFPKKNGQVSYAFGAVDRADNPSKRVQKSVIVDIKPPTVKVNYKGEHYYSRKTHYIRKLTLISLVAADNLSGVQTVNSALDKEPVVLNRKPFRIEAEGRHTLVYSAVDNVNNTSKDMSMEVFVDEKGPEIYHHFGVNPTVPDQEIYPLKSLLYLAATDREAGIRNIFYTIGNGKEMKYKAPLSFKSRRNYKVKVRCIDNVGNVSTASIEFQIK